MMRISLASIALAIVAGTAGASAQELPPLAMSDEAAQVAGLDGFWLLPEDAVDPSAALPMVTWVATGEAGSFWFAPAPSAVAMEMDGAMLVHLQHDVSLNGVSMRTVRVLAVSDAAVAVLGESATQAQPADVATIAAPVLVDVDGAVLPAGAWLGIQVIVEGTHVAQLALDGAGTVAGIRMDVLDSDGDGIGDTAEEGMGTDPSDPDDPAGDDGDGDGIPDDAEPDLGTDPRQPDTDGDGCPDGFEADHGSDPADPQSMPSDVLGRALEGCDEADPVIPGVDTPSRRASSALSKPGPIAATTAAGAGLAIAAIGTRRWIA